MSESKTTKSNAIMQEFGRMMYRDYGVAAYHKFIGNYPEGRSQQIDRAIVEREKRYA